jgi:hypothetical protein
MNGRRECRLRTGPRQERLRVRDAATVIFLTNIAVVVISPGCSLMRSSRSIRAAGPTMQARGSHPERYLSYLLPLVTRLLG